MDTRAELKGCALMALLLTLPTLGGAAPTAPGSEPVAMITDLSGKVLVQQADITTPADLLMSLSAGESLTVPGGARVTLVYYGSAKEYVFAGPDSVSVGADQPVSISGSEQDARTLTALAQHSIDAREVQQLVQAGLQMRSASLRKRIELRSPVDTVVMDTAPLLNWTELEPDVQYRVSLRDEAGLTLLQTLQTRTRLRLPPDLQLREGAKYTWSVEARARNGNEYAAFADFTMATAGQRAALDSLKTNLDGVPSQRVLYAILLQKLGMRAEAAGAWQQLAAERPGSPQLQRMAAQTAAQAPVQGE